VISKKTNNILGSLLVVFLVVLIIRNFYHANLLLKNNQIVNGGYVSSCNYGGKGNAGRVFIDYFFFIKGKKLKGSTVFLTSEISFSDCQNYFVGKQFPVIYVPEKPTINLMLVSPKNFDQYSYKFPDSLNWVRKYLN